MNASRCSRPILKSFIAILCVIGLCSAFIGTAPTSTWIPRSSPTIHSTRSFFVGEGEGMPQFVGHMRPAAIPDRRSSLQVPLARARLNGLGTRRSSSLRSMSMAAVPPSPLRIAAGLVTGIKYPVAVAACKAVAKLVSSCGIGYVLSKKGILDQAALTSLSKLIFYVFQPCLLFVNVASTLSMSGQSFKKLAVLPIFACLQIAIGAFFAKGVGAAVGVDETSEEGREIKMCSSFANSGPLPLLFVDSLFGSHADPTLLPSAVAYISFYLLGWSPMFWTAGYSILAGTPVAKTLTPAEKEAAYKKKFGSNPDLLKKIIISAQEIRQTRAFKRILSPPVLGCIAGAIVGGIPPLRMLMVGRHALLSPVFDSLKALGAAYLPAAILVLAGSLARPGDNTQLGLKPFMQPSFMKKVGGIMACRFLLMPIAAVGLLMGGSKVGVIPYDRLLWFVLLMEGCMPSAQNSVVILQMEKDPAAAASMARTLTAIYLLSGIPIAFLLSIILQFVAL